jgi:predicted phage tail protein
MELASYCCNGPKARSTPGKRGYRKSGYYNFVDRLVIFMQLVLGVAAIVASRIPGTITYRRSTKPFPNQRLARFLFFAMGVGFVLGGMISLLIDLYFRR